MYRHFRYKTIRYKGATRAIKSTNIIWSIKAIVGKASQLLWGVGGIIGKSLQSLWNVLTTIYKAQTSLWNIYISVAKSSILLWNIRSIAGKAIQAIWNVNAWVAKELSALWNIFVLALKSTSFVWNVYALAGKATQIIWNVISWAGRSFSAFWKIFSIIQFLDALDVPLPTLWLLSTSKQAPNTLITNTFKIKNNSSSSLTDAKITIHDNFAHTTLPASASQLAIGNTYLSTGTWTQVGYVNGSYVYLTLGSFASGEIKTISIKTQFNQEGKFYARLHFEAMKGTTPIHADQIICLTYETVTVQKRPGEFRFKVWRS